LRRRPGMSKVRQPGAC